MGRHNTTGHRVRRNLDVHLVQTHESGREAGELTDTLRSDTSSSAETNPRLHKLSKPGSVPSERSSLFSEAGRQNWKNFVPVESPTLKLLPSLAIPRIPAAPVLKVPSSAKVVAL